MYVCVWRGGGCECICVPQCYIMCILYFVQFMADLAVERFSIMKKMRRIFTYSMLVGLRMTYS